MRLALSRSFALSLLTVAPLAQFPLSPTLFKDLNVGPDPMSVGSSPGFLAADAGLVYFSAELPVVYRWPFVTDGTAAGTISLNEVSGTTYGHAYGSVLLPSGEVLLASNSQEYGAELFKIGPGIQGVQLVKDIWPGPDLGLFGGGSGTPSSFAIWQGEAWFFANNGATGDEIWRSDGTASGTVQVLDLVPNGGVTNGTNTIVPAAGKLFFTTTYPEKALWVLDSPGGTPQMLKVLASGTSQSYYMRPLANGVVFTAEDPALGEEPWFSDGTPAGTILLGDLNPGTPDSSARFIAHDDNRVWFEGFRNGEGYELFVTDGTPAGTKLVKDIQPGIGSGTFITTGVVYNGGLAFTANDGVHGHELWTSDGTEAGTVMVLDILPGPDSGYPFSYREWGGDLWFRATDGVSGIELWRSDGTVPGTQLFADFNPGPGDSHPGVLGGTDNYLIFTVDDGVHGHEPWITDGSVAGTSLLANLHPDPVSLPSNPGSFRRWQDQMLFRARTADEGIELWTSDGSAAGTQMIADLLPGPDSSNASPLVELPQGYLFSALTLGTGQELWITNGQAGGTSLVKHFDNGLSNAGISGSFTLGDQAYVRANDGVFFGLWRTDGTEAGTQPLVGMPSLTSMSLYAGAAFQGEFYFRANDGNVTGQELWKTDGTAVGTVPMGDIEPGPAHSFPGGFTEFQDRLYFWATTSAEGQEMWCTDGSVDGTQLFLDAYPGPDSGSPSEFVVIGDRMVFGAEDDVHGRELWVSDGTQAGTHLLFDLLPGVEGSGPRYLTRSGPYVFFWAFNAFELPQLFRTDGTVAGTVLVQSEPGTGQPFSLTPLTAVGDAGQVVFRYNDGVHGDELWISDGSGAGTYLLADSAPGVESSWPNEFARLGGQLFFSADDQLTGWELHAVELQEFGGWVSQPFGAGCGGSIASAGAMQLGSAVSIDAQVSAPLAPSLLYFSDEPAWAELAPGCGLHLANPKFLATTVADPNGFAQTALTIPNSPVLVGDPLYFQYAAVVVGGPFLGLIELTQGLEVVPAP